MVITFKQRLTALLFLSMAVVGGVNIGAGCASEVNMMDFLEWRRNGPGYLKKLQATEIKLKEIETQLVNSKSTKEQMAFEIERLNKLVSAAAQEIEKKNSKQTAKLTQLTLARKNTLNTQKKTENKEIEDADLEAQFEQLFLKATNFSGQSLRFTQNYVGTFAQQTLAKLQQAMKADEDGLKALREAAANVDLYSGDLVRVAKAKRDADLDAQFKQSMAKLEEAKMNAEKATAALVQKSKEADEMLEKEVKKAKNLKEEKSQETAVESNNNNAIKSSIVHSTLTNVAKPEKKGLWATIFKKNAAMPSIETITRDEAKEAMLKLLELPCVLDEIQSSQMKTTLTKLPTKSESDIPLVKEEIKSYFIHALINASNKSDISLEDRIVKMSLNDKNKLLLQFAKQLEIDFTKLDLSKIKK